MSVETKKITQTLMRTAEAELERLRALGWTKETFASALKLLIENPPIQGNGMTASNGAIIEFKTDRVLSGRFTKIARLHAGNWPGREEMIFLADGGGELAGYFGGSVEDLPDGTKRVTVYTD